MKKFILNGHMCPNCAEKIEKDLQANKNIRKLSFDRVNNVIEAQGSNLKAVITDTVGRYEPGVKVLEEGGPVDSDEPAWRSWFNPERVSLLLGILILSLALIFKLKWLTIVGALVAGLPIMIEGLKVVVRGGGLDERFLMTISMIGAILIGEAFEGAMIMILFRIGEACSDYATGRANKIFKALIKSQEVEARIIGPDGVSQMVDVREVAPGTDIQVQPLEMVPLDSLVMSEYIQVDNSSFTGESEPLILFKGDMVMAGALVLKERADLRTASDYEHSSLYRMEKLLDRASASKSKQEKFLTTFARVYTPIVVSLAVLIALLPIFTGGDFKEHIYKALAFLVVACPCALVLGVPLSYAIGIGALSTKGVLVKGSEFIDGLSHLSHLAMDKTGTVTENYLTIDRVEALAQLDEEELRYLMAIGEKHSQHPIARGFKMERVPDPEEYSEIPGLGIDFSYEGRAYQIRGGDISGQVLLSSGGQVLGSFYMIEKLKAKARETIGALDGLGVKTSLVSGDRRDKVSQVAQSLGIGDYLYEQSPEDKLNFIEGMKGSEKIGFVGDGINDSPVLRAADLGISMGEMGSDAAIESSDIVIMDDSIYKVASTIADSRKIVANVKFIIAFVLITKVLTMVSISLGLGGMFMAVFADVGLSILSVIIALTNLRIARK